MAALLVIVSLAAGVCWILTVIKMFTNAGVLHGVLGIICGLWALIWGWQNADELNHKPIMLIWTVCIIASLILRFMVPAESGLGV